MIRRKARSARKVQKRALLDRYKDMLGCALCTNTTSLEFHHIDPATKIEGISRMISMDLGMDSIFAEVEKCEVLCKSCHKMIHDERSDI